MVVLPGPREPLLAAEPEELFGRRDQVAVLDLGDGRLWRGVTPELVVDPDNLLEERLCTCPRQQKSYLQFRNLRRDLGDGPIEPEPPAGNDDKQVPDGIAD